MSADTFWLYKDLIRILLVVLGVILICPSIQFIYGIGISREELLSRRIELTTQGNFVSRIAYKWIYFADDERALLGLIGILAFICALLLETF